MTECYLRRREIALACPLHRRFSDRQGIHSQWTGLHAVVVRKFSLCTFLSELGTPPFGQFDEQGHPHETTINVSEIIEQIIIRLWSEQRHWARQFGVLDWFGNPFCAKNFPSNTTFQTMVLDLSIFLDKSFPVLLNLEIQFFRGFTESFGSYGPWKRWPI